MTAEEDGLSIPLVALAWVNILNKIFPNDFAVIGPVALRLHALQAGKEAYPDLDVVVSNTLKNKQIIRAVKYKISEELKNRNPAVNVYFPKFYYLGPEERGNLVPCLGLQGYSIGGVVVPVASIERVIKFLEVKKNIRDAKNSAAACEYIVACILQRQISEVSNNTVGKKAPQQPQSRLMKIRRR
jgi:hypothetical protein